MLYFEIRDVKNINPQLTYTMSMLRINFRTLATQSCSLCQRLSARFRHESGFEAKPFEALRGSTVPLSLDMSTASVFQLKLLSTAMKKPMTELLETAVAKMWINNERLVTRTVSAQRINREFRQLVHRVKV